MNSPVNDLQKATIMHETALQLVSMIQKRNANRLTVLNTLTGFSVDNVPEEVQKMRETEAAAIRAVMTEQNDIIEIIQMLFPPVKKAEKITHKKNVKTKE